jgi:hypothetical protein
VSINVLLPVEHFSWEPAILFLSGFPGLILPDRLRFGNAGILQNPVHIIGENCRYIEPFVADRERGCQGPGSHKDTLYEAMYNFIL